MRDASAYHAVIEAGGKVSPELEPPELPPGLGLWYDDFLELSTDRQIGMTLGPIPKASIDRHVRGWPDEEAQMFRACMRAMDRVYRAKDDDDDEPGDAVPNAARDAFRAAFR